MRTTDVVRLLAEEYLVPQSVLDRYNEPHRFYHNMKHISDMVNDAIYDGILDRQLFKAIVYHDAVYDPKSRTNEIDSVALLSKDDPDYSDVSKAILSTIDHNTDNHPLSMKLCDLDLRILRGSLSDKIKFEKNIFKEYQWVPFNIYRTERYKILSKLGATPDHLDYLMSMEPKIGFYPGTFNPFHVGHMDILIKAEKIFDKVIVAFGVNPMKSGEINVIVPEALKYREVHTYQGLTTDYISKLGHDVTIVRGVRNHNDMDYEMVQEDYMTDFNPDVKVVYLSSRRDVRHISSSAITALNKIGGGNNYIVK